MAEDRKSPWNATLALLVVIAVMVAADLLFHIVPLLCGGEGCGGREDSTAQLTALDKRIDGLAAKVEPLPATINTVGEQIKVIDEKTGSLVEQVGAIDTELDSLASGEAVAAIDGKTDSVIEKVGAVDAELDLLASKEFVATIDGKVDTLIEQVGAIDTELDSCAAGEAVATIDGKADSLIEKVGAIDTELDSCASGESVAGIDDKADALLEKIGAIDPKLDTLASEETVAAIDTRTIAIDGKADDLLNKIGAKDTEPPPAPLTESPEGSADDAIMGKLDAIGSQAEDLLIKVGAVDAKAGAIGDRLDTPAATPPAPEIAVGPTDGDGQALIAKVDALGSGLATVSQTVDTIATRAEATDGKADTLIANTETLIQMGKAPASEPATPMSPPSSGLAIRAWMAVWFDPKNTTNDGGVTQGDVAPRIVKLIGNRTDCSVFVDGHADSEGDDDDNRRLSRDRSETVIRLLNEYFGEHRPQLSEVVYDQPLGHGERELMYLTGDGESRIGNRRADIFVTCG